MYDVNYFIKKFEAIPERMWLIAKRHDGKGNHCAHGWCNIYEEKNSKEENDLVKVFEPLLYGEGCACINNGMDNRYKQPTPKQRILAALYDIKAMQQPKCNDISKELAVLPVDETSDLTLIKQS